MQAVGRKEGKQAGVSNGRSSNGASNGKLSELVTDAPLLSSEASATPQNSARRSDESSSFSEANAANGGAHVKPQLDTDPVVIRNRFSSEMQASPFEGLLSLPQRFWRRLIRGLSNLSLAIGTLLTIAGFSGLGTLIEQNKSYQFYIDNYPEEDPSFGFLSWKVLLDLQLDHIYTSWWFLSLLAFLAACLMACTSTRQLPMAKVNFLQKLLLLFMRP
jgi:hypothetical protein